MLFVQFCETLAVLEAESSRTALMQSLADFLKQVPADELKKALYMLNGRVVPAYIGQEFNYSNKSFVNALADLAAQRGLTYEVKQRFGVKGDVGELAWEFIDVMRNNEGGKDGTPMLLATATPLKPAREHTINEVFIIMNTLTTTSGQGSNKEKIRIVQEFILEASPLAGKYFARIITGNLRLGVSNKTILDAISWAKTGDKSLRKDLDRAYGLQADIGRIAELVLVENADLRNIHIALGVPLAAQLVEREKDAQAIMTRMPSAIIQPKYDGLRAQLHFNKAGINADAFPVGEAPLVQIYSRNMESLTEMFPDLVAVFAAQSKVESLIIDGEVIGYDENTDSFLPFQETIQRKRKYGVEEAVMTIPIKYFMFDLLYLNGEDLTERPLEERLAILRKLDLDDPARKLEFTVSPVYTDAQALDTFFRDLLDQGLEGVIAKDPKSIYSPGKRSFDWIKLKANTFADLKDSIDTVVMGYYFGRGQRARHGIGGFLVGVYNEDLDCYQSVAKVGSGVKDEEWPIFKGELDKYRVDKLPDNYQVRKPMLPDVIISPKIVAEIDADEITLSKNHLAGVARLLTSANEVPEAAGYSLRFPRVKLFGRDKAPDQSTTVAELKRLYELGKKDGS